MKWKNGLSFLFISALIFLSSCYKEEDFNFTEIRLDGVTPEFAAPVINTELTLTKLLENDAVEKYVQVNSDGFLSLVHEDFSYSLSGTSLVALPATLFSTRSFSMSSAELNNFNAASSGTIINSNSTQKFQFISSIELDEVLYANGEIGINVSNGYSANISYRATFIDVTKNAIAGEISGTLSPLGSDSKTLNINDYLADYTAGTPGDFNQLRVQLEMALTKGAAPATGAQSVSVALTVTNNKYKTIKGYFGNFSASLPSVSVPINVFNLNRGAISFENPKVRISIANDLGVESEISTLSPFNMKLADKSTLGITGISTPLSINSATGFNNPGQTVVNLDKSNSNLSAIISGKPQEFNFGGSVAINPNGKTGIRNLMADTGKITFQGRFELPMHGSASDFGLRDTQDLDLEDLDQEVLEWLEMRLNTSNGFPLETRLQVYIYSKTSGVILDSLFSPGQQPLLPGASTDASGNVTAKTNKITDVRITRDRLKKWNNGKADALIFDAELTTTKNGTVSVKIFPNQGLGIRVGLRTKLTGRFD